MEGLVFDYKDTPEADNAPALPADAFCQETVAHIRQGWRLLALLAVPAQDCSAELWSIMDNASQLCALRSRPLREYESMARECPQTQLFEREIYEDLGIVPKHHPWLKPVRITPDAPGKNPDADYGFYRVQGAQAHEVGVGPIHAGIIEPGHFRFQCYGEKVLHLEIALGYQHRGLEKQLLRLPCHNAASQLRLRLVECIAGDASVAYATALCDVWEKLAKMPRPGPEVQRTRRLGLELERLACHTGDLGAMAGDTGFLPTSAWNGRIRGDFLNLTAEICGNRFGREFMRPGGVSHLPDAATCEAMLARLAASGRDATGSCHAMFASGSVMDRMTGIGALTQAQALELGLVGVAARACGVERDARFLYPQGDLPVYGTKARTCQSGDVLARAQIRLQELEDSLVLARHDLEWLADSNARNDSCKPLDIKLPPGRLAVALVESWRGEVCHVAITGHEEHFLACKFVDPSFHNWIGLAIAMRDGQISDFPLCNKSFNLSYCGHDL